MPHHPGDTMMIRSCAAAIAALVFVAAVASATAAVEEGAQTGVPQLDCRRTGAVHCAADGPRQSQPDCAIEWEPGCPSPSGQGGPRSSLATSRHNDFRDHPLNFLLTF